VTDHQTIEDLLARLDRERLEADRLYNAALTAVDRALQTVPPLPVPPRAYDASRLPAVNAAWNTLPHGAPKVGGAVRGRLARFVWRLVGPALETQQQFNSAVADHLNRNVTSHEETTAALGSLVGALRTHLHGLEQFEWLLLEYLRTITVYVDSKDRSLGGPELRDRLALNEQRLLALKREVDAARSQEQGTVRGHPEASPGSTHLPQSGSGAAGDEGPQAFTGAIDSLTYLAFEDRFRGTQEEIRRRVVDYVPIFAGASSVVDIGCGRGELLGALRGAGITARGVDVSPAMVEICRRAGFDVEVGDALTYMSRQPDSSVGGVIAIQVVEHFTPTYLTRFLEAAYHAMQPGAAIVLETINANCWMAFFETYIRDLTHQQPLHPETLRHLVQASGFSHVDVQFRAPVPDADRLAQVALPVEIVPAGVAAVVEALNDHASKLNRRMFSWMDFVVIGRR
jgi:SAM-dependent methyltransferase